MALIKLSILIRVAPVHELIVKDLIDHLMNQSNESVEILIDFDKEISSGKKAQWLLEQAKGEYIVFVDADDWVPGYYVSEILKAIKTNPDCIATNGNMTTNGENDIKWFLSKDFENQTRYSPIGEKYYLRKTNHISPVRRELALKVGFPDISNAEDKDYSERLNQYLKTEVKIDLPMYHYRFQTFNKSYV